MKYHFKWINLISLNDFLQLKLRSTGSSWSWMPITLVSNALRWLNLVAATEKKESESVSKARIVDVLNRFGNQHWCNELGNIIEIFSDLLVNQIDSEK